MFRTLTCFLALLFFYSSSTAQDGHYWTQQYGTRSMLLSGSIIGGVDDLGAVYYNPARLSVISSPSFLLSASVYEYNSLTVTGAFGDAKNAAQSSIRGVPTLAAGTFSIKKLPKHFFAYSILTRQSANLDLSYRDEVTDDVIPTLPGIETFGAQISMAQSSSEEWVGLSWAHPLSEKLSVGITTNFSTSTRSKNGKTDMQALSQSNEVAVYRFDRSFTFKSSGFVWKAGLAWHTGNWQTGLTITTPYVGISGSGTYQYEEFFSSATGLAKAETYSSSYQKGLATTNKTPLSVGFGVSRKFGKNRIHFSTEWFAAVNKYVAMSAADHASQSNPTDIISFHLIDQANSVWNAGIGGELYFSPKVSGFASFSTDFSSLPADITRFVERSSEASANGWAADFYNFGTGVVLTLKGADITLGATHVGANQTVPRPVSFPDASNSNIFSTTDTADVRWDRWRLVFSFSFPFLKDYADKLQGEKK
jgi:hypothetical protein